MPKQEKINIYIYIYIYSVCDKAITEVAGVSPSTLTIYSDSTQSQYLTKNLLVRVLTTTPPQKKKNKWVKI